MQHFPNMHSFSLPFNKLTILRRYNRRSLSIHHIEIRKATCRNVSPLTTIKCVQSVLSSVTFQVHREYLSPFEWDNSQCPFEILYWKEIDKWLRYRFLFLTLLLKCGWCFIERPDMTLLNDMVWRYWNTTLNGNAGAILATRKENWVNLYMHFRYKCKLVL